MNASSLPSHKFVGFFFLLLLFYPFLFYYFSYLFCNWKSPGISLTTSQDDSETLTTQQRVPVPTWVPLESDKSLGCALTSQKHRPGTSVCSFPSFRLPRGGGRQASNDTKGKGSTGRVTLANSNNSSWLWKQPSHPKRSFFFFSLFPPQKTRTAYFQFWAGSLAMGQLSPLPLRATSQCPSSDLTECHGDQTLPNSKIKVCKWSLDYYIYNDENVFPMLLPVPSFLPYHSECFRAVYSCWAEAPKNGSEAGREINLQAGFPGTFFLILHKIVDIPPDFAVIIWVSLLHRKGQMNAFCSLFSPL